MMNDSKKPAPYASLPSVPAFALTSNDVKNGETFHPDQRAGAAGGSDISPQLSWSGAPAKTKSYTITIFDPDAPTPSGFWHWAVTGIPATVTSLPRNAGASDGAQLPQTAVQLPNDARLKSYIGAAPPKGHGAHRYFIVVHALDVETLPVPNDGTPAYLSFVMLQHTLARATLVATAETPGGES